MKSSYILTVLAATLATCLSANAQTTAITANSNDTFQEKLYDTFEKNRDAIVKVFAQKTLTLKNKDGQQAQQFALDVGSGFIIGKDGIVMTSAYVTQGADKIWIEWRGILLDAKSLGLDPLTTVALLKIDGDIKSKNPSIINIDGSAPLPKIATLLMAISYEMGLPPAPEIGIATSHNIEFGGNFLPTVYVRTNIPAPRGSTGGAVFDMNGKFVGMTIASLPEIGGSFILPARAAAKIRDDIMLGGEPVYSWFGLRAQDADNGENTKVVVNMVAENAPAKKAGFAVGDVILEINSQKIADNTQLRNITFFIRPTEITQFKVMRKNEILTIEVKAEKLSSDIIHAAENTISPARHIIKRESAAPDRQIKSEQTSQSGKK